MRRTNCFPVQFKVSSFLILFQLHYMFWSHSTTPSYSVDFDNSLFAGHVCLGLCVIVCLSVFVHASPHACIRLCPATLKGVGCSQYVLSCYFAFVCMCVCACTYRPYICVCLLKWSYLSQHSSPMTGGMEGSRGGDPQRDHGQLSRGPVSVEVQEQVEVWILNIEKLHGSSVFTPMVTALKGEDGDRLSTSSIPQT